MKNILFVSGHSDLNNSFANKLILEKLEELMPDAQFDYLDRLYPNYVFDVEAEQEKLVAADIIVLQYPFFWYGMPGLMHKWIEDVFVHGFSHGRTGNALHGKKLVVSFTSGAPEEMYVKGGPQNYPIEDFLPPVKQFASLCGLEWCGYVYSGGLSYASRHDEEKLKMMKEKALNHSHRVYELVSQL